MPNFVCKIDNKLQIIDPTLYNPVANNISPNGTWFYYLVKNDGINLNVIDVKLDTNYAWHMMLVAPGGLAGKYYGSKKGGGGGGGQVLNASLPAQTSVQTITVSLPIIGGIDTKYVLRDNGIYYNDTNMYTKPDVIYTLGSGLNGLNADSTKDGMGGFGGTGGRGYSPIYGGAGGAGTPYGIGNPTGGYYNGVEVNLKSSDGQYCNVALSGGVGQSGNISSVMFYCRLI